MNSSSTSLEASHFPVMLEKIIQICSPKKGETFVDCTFGGGGYSNKLLKFQKTKVIAFDRDNFILQIAGDIKKKYPKRFFFYRKKFSQINTVLSKNSADNIIFDLGLSSIQLNNFKRGFSFKSKDKLDMSMGLTDISAEEVVNNCSEKKLGLIIKILGEEKEAFNIAKNIIKARNIKRISHVDQLYEIIIKSKKKNYHSKINPCTKTFQALRIFVNKEITELITGIINAAKIIKPGGKILIVSFHSIEDKIVKYFFNNFSLNRARSSRYFPESDDRSVLFEKYQNKIFRPSNKEIKINPPSRSAKLRFAIRNDDQFVYPTKLEDKFKKYLTLESNYV